MASPQVLPCTTTDLERSAHMLLVLRSRHGVFALELIELLVSDSGPLVMRKLRERLNKEGVLQSKIRLAAICRRMSVEIAEINLVNKALAQASF
jgi:hypothetical protein